MSVARVPIVCGASLFDLSVGDPHVRPDKQMGYLACLDSESNEIKRRKLWCWLWCQYR